MLVKQTTSGQDELFSYFEKKNWILQTNKRCETYKMTGVNFLNEMYTQAHTHTLAETIKGEKNH